MQILEAVYTLVDNILLDLHNFFYRIQPYSIIDRYMIYDTTLGPNTAGLKAQSSEHGTFKISKACVSDTIEIYIRDCHL